LPLIATYAVLHCLLYFVLDRFTDSVVPFFDSMSTALSIVAMWMLSRKLVEQWLVWLLVDAISVGLYLYKGIPITGCLYLVYCVLAVMGYVRWMREARRAGECSER
jgi:nicotinamide mononucleotide transporter